MFVDLNRDRSGDNVKILYTQLIAIASGVYKKMYHWHSLLMNDNSIILYIIIYYKYINNVVTNNGLHSMNVVVFAIMLLKLLII